MKKIRKISMFATLALSTSILLAGCGDSGSQTSQDNSQNSGKDITLDVSLAGTDAQGTEALAKEFEKQNPGVKVVVERDPDAKVHETNLEAKLSAKVAPDVFLDGPGTRSAIAKVKAGYIEDISDFPVLQHINKQYLSGYTVDGKVYGIPWGVNYMAIYYNKDLFAKNNLQVPTNWDDFMALCEKLKSMNIIPIALAGKTGLVQGPWQNLSATLVYSKNPQWDNDRYQNKDTFVKSAGWNLAADKYQTLLDKGYFGKQSDILGIDTPQVAKLIADGKAAMSMDGSWDLPTYQALEKENNIHIGTMLLPGNGAGEKGYLTSQSSHGFLISKDSHNLDMAKKFVQFITSGDNAIKLAGEGSILPEDNLDFKIDPISEGILPYLKNNQFYPLYSTNWPGGLDQDIIKSTQAALGGGENFKQVLQDVDNQWNDAIKK